MGWGLAYRGKNEDMHAGGGGGGHWALELRDIDLLIDALAQFFICIFLNGSEFSLKLIGTIFIVHIRHKRLIKNLCVEVSHQSPVCVGGRGRRNAQNRVLNVTIYTHKSSNRSGAHLKTFNLC